jgi:hypothetical protein
MSFWLLLAVQPGEGYTCLGTFAVLLLYFQQMLSFDRHPGCIGGCRCLSAMLHGPAKFTPLPLAGRARFPLEGVSDWPGLTRDSPNSAILEVHEGKAMSMRSTSGAIVRAAAAATPDAARILSGLLLLIRP